MRILFANEDVDEAGGVNSYLTAVMDGLARRGHDIAILHHNALRAGSRPDGVPHRRFSITEDGLDAAFKTAADWRPDICFAHNMQYLEVEQRLVMTWPVVKMMHGYFGTCIGGQKSFGLPVRQPCDRTFGPACLGFYLPRRCGHLRIDKMIDQYRWAKRQQALFPLYKAIVVASDHMGDEYVQHGIPAEKVHVLPLFPTLPNLPPVGRPEDDPSTGSGSSRAESRDDGRTVLFMGRMTKLKGGDLLVSAVARANRRLRTGLQLIMAGEGPQRRAWSALAERLNVRASFPGWIDGEERTRTIRRSTVLVVPSVWPEPFGLVGLEAAAMGLPVIAFDVGGVKEWLRDGVNGRLVPADPPSDTGLAHAIYELCGRRGRLDTLRQGARSIAQELSLERHLDSLERVLADASAAGNDAVSAGAPEMLDDATA